MKIAVITGTRSEYGIWRPILQRLHKSPRLKLQLIVTGMHLLKEFGHTIDEIQKDPFPIAATVEMYHSLESPAQSLARATANFDTAFTRLNPDLVLLLGDRLEILAAAQAAMCQNKIIAHVHGGETAPGQYDEQIRHAVTKLAHLHFCSTPAARRRILQMGEPTQNVFQVGAPALSEIEIFWKQQGRALRKSRLPAPLLVLHPTTPDIGEEFHRTGQLLRTLLQLFPGKLRVIGPNNDPGHRGILSAYAAFMDRIDLSMSLPQKSFWHEAARRALLIGNSSSGIIEMASLALPVINLGPRQQGRERSPNTLDIPFSPPLLKKAIHRALSDKKFLTLVNRRQNIYGDARAPQKILQTLLSLKPSQLNPTKKFHDL